jgi:hypothetical protein
LNERFHLAVRIREIKQGVGYRLYQVRKPKNRHLVGIRRIDLLPSCDRIDGILVPVPSELIGQKVSSMASRANTPKGLTDGADLRRLLLAFPELKSVEGPVTEALRVAQVSEAVHQAWRDLVAQEILPDDEDSGY